MDEAREAGIEHFVFVTGRGKAVIEDHFDKAFELDATLASRGKTKELEALASDLPKAGQASFTRQQEPLGLGHAIWCARAIVGDEPFAIFLPDELMIGSPGCMKQMVDAYNEVGGNLISALIGVSCAKLLGHGVAVAALAGALAAAFSSLAACSAAAAG